MSIAAHPRRHPLCPACRYDLVTTVARRGRVCPECGYEFETTELIAEVLPGDWTIWRGARVAAKVLLWRSLVWIVVWGAVIWGATLLVTWGNAHVPWIAQSILQLMAGVAILGVGCMTGAVLVRGISGIAGFDGGLVAALTIGFAWVVVFAAPGLVALIGVVNSGQGVVLTVVAGGMSSVWIVRVLMMESV